MHHTMTQSLFYLLKQRVSRYMLVSGFATLLDYTIYSTLLLLGAPYWLGIITGYLASTTAHFFVTRKVVFRNGSKIRTTQRELMAIYCIATIAIGLNIIIVDFLNQLIGIDYFTARVVAIGLVFFYNYYTRKTIIYH